MKQALFLTLSILLIDVFSSAKITLSKAPGRMDPHGKRGQKPSLVQIAEPSPCIICHTVDKKNDRLILTPTMNEICINCHNTSPHSGVAEHLKHQVTCIACHSPHRGDQISWTPNSGKFQGLYEKPLASEELIDRPASSAMLKKNCGDCHNKW